MNKNTDIVKFIIEGIQDRKGNQNSQWIVIDYGDTFVHVFLPDVRQYYNLEELWSDADINEIPDLD